MISSRQHSLLTFLILIVAMLVSGCTQEEIVMQSNGTLHLSIGQTSKVSDTRATPAQLGKPLVERFNLKVVKNGHVHYDDKFVDELELRVGTYDITAYYGEDVVIGKDAPYYEGTATAQIEKDASTSVTIPCRVANALVSVAFGRDEEERNRFYKFYANYGLMVQVGSHSLAITDEEENVSVYFPADSNPTLYFYGVLRENGEVVSCELQSDALPETFAAADHALVTLSLPEPASAIGVNISKVDVETVTVEETIPLSWLPAPIATALHCYDNAGYLVGTNVAFSSSYPGMRWRAVVSNAAGEEVRNIEGVGELQSSHDSSQEWPYLPSGNYKATYYVMQGEEEKEVSSREFSVGKPELKISVGGYSSYTKYLEGDIDGANACDRGTVYSPSVQLNVSEALLAIYDNTFSCTFAGYTTQVPMGKNRYSWSQSTGLTASFEPYQLKAEATFDGVMVNNSKDFYITGLPANFTPPTTTAGWVKSSGNVTFNSSDVKLDKGAVANSTFAIPVGTNVALDYGVTVRAGALFASNTLTITLGEDELFSQKVTGNIFSKSNDYSDTATTEVSSRVLMLKCNSSNSYSTISRINLKYNK